jgi:hypothetical protein
MKLRETLHLPLPARTAAAMYADPEYTAIRRGTLGADDASSHVEGDPAGAFTVTTELALPTDRVPEIVKPFVGAAVTVREVQSWSAPEPDGSRSGSMRLDVVGAKAGLTASLRLAAQDQERSEVEIDGDLVAKVPLLGPRIEKAAIPYVSTVLRAEERSAAAYRDRAGA